MSVTFIYNKTLVIYPYYACTCQLTIITTNYLTLSDDIIASPGSKLYLINESTM